jgi:hypothetical protein
MGNDYNEAYFNPWAGWIESGNYVSYRHQQAASMGIKFINSNVKQLLYSTEGTKVKVCILNREKKKGERERERERERDERRREKRRSK